MSDEKKKAMKRISILYMCVAMAVCVALAVAIAAVSSLSMNEISVPGISFAPDTSSADTVSDVPTGGDNSNVDVSVKTKYVYPVYNGGIQKGYSIDKLVFSQSMNDWRTHSGVDIAGEVGTDVFCYADGTVSKVYTDPLYGKTVEIQHGDGLTTIYSNLDETLYGIVDEGIQLLAGERIGRIGSTAGTEAADKPHLHFEMQRGGQSIDPTGYLDLAEGGPDTQTGMMQ